MQSAEWQRRGTVTEVLYGAFGASVQALRDDQSTFEGTPFVLGRSGVQQTRLSVAELPSAIGFLVSLNDDALAPGLLKGSLVSE